MIEWKKIVGKGNYRELVYIWGDKSITDIVYRDRPSAKNEIEHNHDNVMCQYNTYGEKAAKELAEYYLKAQTVWA